MQLNKFSIENLKRCEARKGFNHKLKSWFIEQWTNAVAGEIGEACNIAKKILRIRNKVRGNKFTDLDKHNLQQKCAKELCDVIIYCDLAIQSLGYDTETILIEVFNAKSIEIGYNRILNNRELSNLI